MTSTKSKRTITAQWPLSSLMRSLSQSGWGTLNDEVAGVRLVLRGLTDRLNDADARGKVTQYQLEECTGLSARWIRTCLKRLEDLGIIRWWRGGFKKGIPMPSFIEIKKKRLVEIIKAAKQSVQERRKANKAARIARMSTLRSPFAFIQGKRKEVQKLSKKVHAEVTTSLRPLTGDCPPGKSPCEDLFTYQQAPQKKKRKYPEGIIPLSEQMPRAERIAIAKPYLERIKTQLGMRS